MKRSPCIKRKNGTACFKSFFESIFSAKGTCTVDAFIGGHKRRSHACPVIIQISLYSKTRFNRTPWKADATVIKSPFLLLFCCRKSFI